MANKLYNEESIRDIAVAIREKNGTANTYNVSEMGQAIRGIQTEAGGITPSGTVEITTNGIHDVTQYASASVNVQAESGGITPSGDITITENGRFDVTNYAGAVVNVPSGGAELPSGIAIGSFSVDEDTTATISFAHGLSWIPQMLSVYVENADDIIDVISNCILGGMMNNSYSLVTTSAKGFSAKSSVCSFTADNTNITVDIVNAGYKLKSGFVYRWMAWK